MITDIVRMRLDSRVSQSGDNALVNLFERVAMNLGGDLKNSAGLDPTRKRLFQRLQREDAERQTKVICFRHAGTIHPQGSASTPSSSGRALPL